MESVPARTLAASHAAFQAIQRRCAAHLSLISPDSFTKSACEYLV
jgi:hypothetical protein